MMTEETPLIPMDGRRVGRAIVAYFHVLFRYSSRRFPTPMSVRPTTSALYRCLDKVLEHKQALLGRLPERWRGLFGAKFDVLLYDLTSTYFESSTLRDEKDKRSDCVQVVIALIVTPEGFPLAYEVLADNTSDRNTLREFLKTI